MAAMKQYGATLPEWAAGKRLAKRDLLPVVSNPHVVLGKFSKMKVLGKTPSQVIDTSDGPRAIGFSDWTSFEATVVNIEAWQKVPDHGMCIQTRLIRAIDIDTDDEDRAAEIEAFFVKRLGPAPARIRAGSARRILVYRVVGEVRRASFPVNEWVDEETGKTKRELVELLGNGQQFVAAGMHKSGQRYEWRDGFPKPEDLEEVEPEELGAVFEAAHERFSCGDLRMAGRRDPTLPGDLVVEDPVAEHLIDSGWPTHSCERGKLYLDCPGKHLHSSDNGETETAWMLAGTGNYRNGHFVCLHQSCKAEVPNDGAFLKAVGYRPAKPEGFDDLTTEGDEIVALYSRLVAAHSVSTKAIGKPAVDALAKVRPDLPLPGFERDNRGRIVTKMENVVRGLRSRQVVECDLAFDRCRAELMISETAGAWCSLKDADVIELLMRLERLPFTERIRVEMVRHALTKLEAERQFDSAQLWLTEVVPAWDCIPRIHRFYPDYLKTADTAYTRALGLYSWTAQAGRILEPGLQVDMIPVLVGAEGLRKTSALKAMVPAKEFYGEFNLSKDDTELARLMRGKLVGELAELRGMSRREGEAIKAWITRTDEEWTPKYRERPTALARRVVFYGTSNDDDFLQVHMGERRWAPVTVLSMIDTDRIAADRLQLWAEAREVFGLEGLVWKEAERLSKGERSAYRGADAWQHRVDAWLDDPDDLDEGVTPRMRGTLRGEEVLTQCLGIPVARISRADQNRIGAVLKAAGMISVQRKIDGRTTRVWINAGLESGVGPSTAKRLSTPA